MSPADLLQGYPVLYPLVVGLFGLVVGSFLNVVILRLPVMMEAQWRRECQALLTADEDAPDRDGAATLAGAGDGADGEYLTLAFPASRCPSCATPIKPWQNIPVLSFLLLRGRCAACGASIGWRYPTVELLTGLAAVVIALYCTSWPQLSALLALTFALIALTGIDIDTQLLPDDITLPLLWAGLLYNTFLGAVPLRDAVLGAAGGYLILWSVYWLFRAVTGKEGMGYGDFKLLAALGAWLGWQSLPLIILLSSVVGAVLGIALIVLRGRDRAQPMPFGPYLAIAGWIALLWGDRLMQYILIPPP